MPDVKLLRLIDPMRGAPGGWEFVIPETGYVIRAANYNAWIEKAMKHLAANGIDTTNYIQKMEDSICRKLPPGYCVQEGEVPLAPPVVITKTGCRRGCGGKSER